MTGTHPVVHHLPPPKRQRHMHIRIPLRERAHQMQQPRVQTIAEEVAEEPDFIFSSANLAPHLLTRRRGSGDRKGVTHAPLNPPPGKVLSLNTTPSPLITVNPCTVPLSINNSSPFDKIRSSPLMKNFIRPERMLMTSSWYWCQCGGMARRVCVEGSRAGFGGEEAVEGGGGV